MARLLSQYSVTGRDKAHEKLGILGANLQWLLDRRWVADYKVLVKNIWELDKQIQNIRGGNIDDMIARGGVEAARNDMVNFFNAFIARVESNPPGIHGVAQAINPHINVRAFNVSPAREFGQATTAQVIEELRAWNGPFAGVEQAVEQSRNTDLYVLFALYAAARAAFQRVQNPAQAQVNQAQIDQLSRQRAHLIEVRDELAGPYDAYNKEETKASVKTWASRGVTTIVWAAVWATLVAWNKQTPPPVAPQAAPITAPNQANQKTVNGHTVMVQGSSITLSPVTGKGVKIGGELFQLNIAANQGWAIVWSISTKVWGAMTPTVITNGQITHNGKVLEVKRSGNNIVVSYDNDSVTF